MDLLGKFILNIIWILTNKKETQTALFYLYYIRPEFQKKNENKNMVSDYFDKHYFSRRQFLLNFLSRNQGDRWNGRFKKFYHRNKMKNILNAFRKGKLHSKENLKGKIWFYYFIRFLLNLNIFSEFVVSKQKSKASQIEIIKKWIKWSNETSSRKDESEATTRAISQSYFKEKEAK